MSDTDRILSDIRAYLRISAAAASRVSAASILNSYEKALVYSKLGGQSSQSKIEQATKVPQRTISYWVDIFVQAQLVLPPDEYNPSHRAMFTLQELGIELETLKRREKTGAKPSHETMPRPPQEKSGEAQQRTSQNQSEEEKNGTTKQ